MKKVIYVVLVSMILIAWVFWYIYLSEKQSGTNTQAPIANIQQTSQKVYEHIFPEVVTKSDFFQGTFIQNDVAGIYPRREALVKDILVDIGDSVSEWQTLAILFEPWVEWQSQSSIWLKSAVVQAQSKILNDTKKIASAKISEFDAMIVEEKKKITEKRQVLEKTIQNIDSKILDERKKIEEKKDVLEKTRDNYNSRIKQTSNQYETQKESLKNKLTLERDILETLETNLENIRNTRDEKLRDALDNISQKKELLATKIDEVYTQIIPYVYIGEESRINYEDIQRGRLNDFFSAWDSQNLQKLIFEIQKFQSERTTSEVLSQYDILKNINSYLLIGLENTIFSVGDTDEDTIASYISQTKSLQTQLIGQKEIYDDALSVLKVLEISENEKVSNLEKKIWEQKSKIALESGNKSFIETDESLAVIDSEKQLQLKKLQSEIDVLEAELNTQSGSERLLQIEKLESEIDILEAWVATLTQSRKLLSANENKQITSASNGVSIAQADLNKEYVATKDFKIISPFSGTISKRDVEIGAMVSPVWEAFRIAWVDNSLSRITKKEIQFFVPESLQDQIQMDQEIYFSTSDESQSFTGTVYRISPEIDPDTRAITIQAKVSDDIQISNKTSLRVALESRSLNYRIPSASIYNKDERKIVYYKKDNGKLWVQDLIIISDDWEFALVSGAFDSTLKVVTTPIFVK